MLVVTTAVFVIGTTVEKGKESSESASERAEETGSEDAHAEGGESAESGEDEESTVFGIDRESRGVIAIAALLSFAVAALVWFRPRRSVWVIVALLGIAFLVADIGEVRHQLDESADGVALLAAVVAAGHLAVAAMGALGARRPIS